MSKRQFDETTIQAMDGWRTELMPPQSRSKTVRWLFEERLSSGKCQRQRGHKAPSPRPNLDRLAALYTLNKVSGMGPIKFREMHEAGVDPRAALEYPELLPFVGRTGEKLRASIANLSVSDVEWGQERAIEQTESAYKCGASILLHG